MKEATTDRLIRSWAMSLANRSNTTRIVASILLAVLVVAFALVVIGLLAGAAFAAAPDHSFAAATLGIEDPTWKTIANAFFWLILGLIIVAVVLEIFRRPRVRDRYTSAEYNEAVGLRRMFIPDGGDIDADIGRPVMSVGEAVYIVGVVAIERVFALGVIALIVFAAIS